MLSATLPKGSVGPYQLQAAIAAVHDEAARAEDTDWPQILALYDLLRRMSDNPMVMLNHAIAAAMVHGPAKAGAAGRAQNGRPPGGSSPPGCRSSTSAGTRGRPAGAVGHYRAAAGKTASLPERNYLLTQAARLSSKLRLTTNRNETKPPVGNRSRLA